MFCTNCGQELPAMAKFCPNCGKEAVQQQDKYVKELLAQNTLGTKISQVKAAIEHEKTIQAKAEPTDTKHFNKNDNTMSLVEFRQNAPFMTGHREKLLAYRKGLPNSWDYNAYVGILLGVGGSKHGDAACMNFAIGQGDNGNNTRKTLEARGLMPVFEKYKGKKLDTSVVLSDVEDEIISIVPEYAQIRNKLAAILQMKNDNLSTTAETQIESVNMVQNNLKLTIADVTEPKKIEELPIERSMLEKYNKLPCHKVAYSFITCSGQAFL